MVKKGLGILILGLVLAGGLGYYYWRQLLALPVWYDSASPVDGATPPLDADRLAQESAAIEARLQGRVQGQSPDESQGRSSTLETSPAVPSIRIRSDVLVPTPSEPHDLVQAAASQHNSAAITLSEPEVNTLVLHHVSQTPLGQALVSSAQAVQTTIAPDAITVGLVINLSAVPQDDLSPREQGILQGLEAVSPLLNQRSVYVGVRVKPDVEAGRWVWDEGSTLQVGGFRLSLSQVSQGFGVSQEQLAHRLDQVLAPLDINMIELGDRQITVTRNP